MFSGFTTAEDLIADILQGPDGSGCQQPPEERSRTLVEHTVYAAIWRGDPGLGHLEPIPAQWVQILDASEQWRQGMLAVPTEVLARWVIACRPLIERYPAGVDGEIDRVCEEFLGPYGISEELLERVTGRGSLGDLTSEETGWLVYAPLADDYCSEWCWLTHEAVREIDKTQGGN